jgi:hypothetical protein
MHFLTWNYAFPSSLTLLYFVLFCFVLCTVVDPGANRGQAPLWSGPLILIYLLNIISIQPLVQNQALHVMFYTYRTAQYITISPHWHPYTRTPEHTWLIPIDQCMHQASTVQISHSRFVRLFDLAHRHRTRPGHMNTLWSLGSFRWPATAAAARLPWTTSQSAKGLQPRSSPNSWYGSRLI